MAIAPYVYMQIPTLSDMNSHLVDYGGGYNRIALLQRSAQEALESMTGQSLGFFAEQGMKCREGDILRVKQEPCATSVFAGKYLEPGLSSGKFPDPGLTKYHQAGKMFSMGRGVGADRIYREGDLVNREKDFINMVLFQDLPEMGGVDGGGSGDVDRAADFSFSGAMQRLTDRGMSGATEEACDLSRRSSSSCDGMSASSSSSSMSPPSRSPPSRSSLMPSPMPMSHSPLPLIGMPPSPILLSPGSPGMPLSPLPAYPQNPKPGNGLYYLHRGHHPIHHSILHGRAQPGGKRMHVYVSKIFYFFRFFVFLLVVRSIFPVALAARSMLYRDFTVFHSLVHSVTCSETKPSYIYDAQYMKHHQGIGWCFRCSPSPYIYKTNTNFKKSSRGCLCGVHESPHTLIEVSPVYETTTNKSITVKPVICDQHILQGKVVTSAGMVAYERLECCRCSIYV